MTAPAIVNGVAGRNRIPKEYTRMKRAGPRGPARWTMASSRDTRTFLPSCVRKRSPAGVKKRTYADKPTSRRKATSLIRCPAGSRKMSASRHPGILQHPRAACPAVAGRGGGGYPETMGNGWMPDRIVKGLARLFTWNRPLRELWARHAAAGPGGEIPWAPLRKSLADCTVALVTTAGVHLAGDVPFDMEDRRGDPTCREIPGGTRAQDLVVTHDYYDHRDADRDVNIVFPSDRLREMAGDGEIGRVAP